jgi:hypothetical protein
VYSTFVAGHLTIQEAVNEKAHLVELQSILLKSTRNYYIEHEGVVCSENFKVHTDNFIEQFAAISELMGEADAAEGSNTARNVTASSPNSTTDEANDNPGEASSFRENTKSSPNAVLVQTSRKLLL